MWKFTAFKTIQSPSNSVKQLHVLGKFDWCLVVLNGNIRQEQLLICEQVEF